MARLARRMAMFTHSGGVDVRHDPLGLPSHYFGYRNLIEFRPPDGVNERRDHREALMDRSVPESTRARERPRRAAVGLAPVLVSMLALFVTAGAAEAAVRQTIPEEQAGPPFYARIISQVPGTENQSAVVFYRDPGCIPSDFNLLQTFDIPRAFGCPLTVEGFVIWKNGPPPIDFAPIQQQLFGLGAVPIWFVSTADLTAATADGVLTIGELAALPSLIVGTASFFHETLHPTQGARVPMIEMNARGTLSDGRTFQIQGVCAVHQDCRNGHVRFKFR